MKGILCVGVLIGSLTMTACSAEPSVDSDDVWGTVQSDTWQLVPVIKNRIATEEDVERGHAVFYIEGASEPYPVALPSLASWVRPETSNETVVIIQAEKTNEEVLLGIRPVSGGNAVVKLEDLEIIGIDDVEEDW